MARSRMIKPEFWDDEKLAKCSRDSRLTFIGMWNQSDDYGVVKGNLKWLMNKIFPYDEISTKKFQNWVEELEKCGFIFKFNSNGETYFNIVSFLKHQKVEKPSKTRNPEAPTTQPVPDKLSTIPHPLPDEDKYKHKGSIKEVKSLPAKPDTELFNTSRNWFINFTKEKINPNYEFSAKEGKNLKLILSKIKRAGPQATDEQLNSAFQFLINKAMQEDWIRERWEISMINSQYNKITNPKNKQNDWNYIFS